MNEMEHQGLKSGKRKGKKRLISVVIQVLLSALFVFLTLRKVTWTEVLEGIEQVSLLILSLSLVSKMAGFMFMSWRSQLLLAPLHRYRFGTLIRSIFVGFVGNNLLPFRMGEFLRIHYLSDRGGVAHGSCLAVIVVERMLDALCLLLLFFACLPFLWGDLPEITALIFLGVLLVCFLIFAVVLSRRPAWMLGLCRWVTRPLGEKVSGWIIQQLERFAEGLSGLSSPLTVISVILISMGYWGTSMASVQIWIWAFGFDLPVFAPLVILIFISFGTMLPATPGYVGTYHYFVKLALTNFGIGPALAASFAIVGHAMAILPFTLFGAPLVLHDLMAGKRAWEARLKQGTDPKDELERPQD